MSKKGGLSDVHRRRDKIDRARKQDGAEHDAMHAIYRQADAIQNEIDRAWLKSLVETPNILEASKKAALSASLGSKSIRRARCTLPSVNVSVAWRWSSG